MILRTKDALEKAVEHIREMAELTFQELTNLRVEEVELNDDLKVWDIILGYNVETYTKASDVNQPYSILMQGSKAAETPQVREFKSILINAETGEFMSMINKTYA